jgi:cation transport regulator ChaC
VSARGLWIFGYGSIVFRPAFPFERAEPAYVRGYSRRFWQGSTDHRGVPGAPGRVATLVRDEGATCFGRAFLVSEGDRARVLDQLDVREQGGYERLVLSAHRPDGSLLTPEALVYVATPENQNWLGEAPVAVIAEEVRVRRGPSGANDDYVLRLARALREMDAHDEHVFAIEAHLEARRGA